MSKQHINNKNNDDYYYFKKCTNLSDATVTTQGHCITQSD